MTTSNWLTIVIALVSSAGMIVTGAVTWGGMKVRMSACETALLALTRGHEKRGERLGVVEEKVGEIIGALGAQAPVGRARTRTRPVPIDVSASEDGEDT